MDRSDSQSPRPLVRVIAAVVFSTLLVGSGPDQSEAYRAAPPPGHTGGFGEPTCHRCHFAGELNDPQGQLSVDGLPEAYVPGRTYIVTVTVARPGMGRGGFQLTARWETGAPAGRLRPVDDRVQVVLSPNQVPYAHHSKGGTSLSDSNAARWRIEWKAPPRPAGPIVWHVVANATNDDDSEFGDFVYRTARTLLPPSTADPSQP